MTSFEQTFTRRSASPQASATWHRTRAISHLIAILLAALVLALAVELTLGYGVAGGNQPLPRPAPGLDV